MVRRDVRRHGVHLVVVDYLGLLDPENPKDNQVHRIGLLARRLKEIARSCSVAVIVLCQLNREVEGRNDGKPRLSDLRDSGEIEQHCDVALLLSKAERNLDQSSDVWLMNLEVAKNRNGPTGEITLAFRRTNTRFENARIDC